MYLSPREKDKLLISMAADVARKRLNRGLKLNLPETIAIISDFVQNFSNNLQGYVLCITYIHTVIWYVSNFGIFKYYVIFNYFQTGH